MLGRAGTLGGLVLLVGIGIGSHACAGTFEQQIAGGIAEIARDIGEDGWTSFTGMLLGKGRPGSAQIRVEIEPEPPLAPTGACPPSTIEERLVAIGFVVTFKDLSLLSAARESGVLCIDLATGNASVNELE